MDYAAAEVDAAAAAAASILMSNCVWEREKTLLHCSGSMVPRKCSVVRDGSVTHWTGSFKLTGREKRGDRKSLFFVFVFRKKIYQKSFNT